MSDEESHASSSSSHSKRRGLRSPSWTPEPLSVQLPIHSVKEEILKLVEANQVVVVTGDTGSGKSTQLPQLLQTGKRRVAVTQPRRVGAISLAKRVAEELGTRLGHDVGYTIRFEDMTSSRTNIRYITDGCLLRECLGDQELRKYDVLILDEAHERSLHTDILFGLVRRLCEKRPDFRVVITSATLDSSKFSRFFFDCPMFHIPGRCYSVQIFHAQEARRFYVEAAVDTALKIHQEQPPDGHILCFLTGQEEIERACRKLGKKVDSLIEDGVDLPDIVILPAYAHLSSHLQQRIFMVPPDGCRKVVFSTNICETSLTVDGVSYVVDCGLVKQRIFNPKTGIDSLQVVPISKVQAKQRAGRAGRTKEGMCYRLYPKKSYDAEFHDETVPEIQRSSLDSTVLFLKSLGINDPLSFEFLDNPSTDAVVDALLKLFYLGAIDEDGRITRVGRDLSEYPLEPQLSKLLVTAAKKGCLDEMLSVTCMLASDNIWVWPADKEEQILAAQRKEVFASRFGDHVSMLLIYELWKENGFLESWCEDNYIHFRALNHARKIRQQLEEICVSKQLFSNRHRSKRRRKGRDRESDSDDDQDPITLVRQVVAQCFFMHGARRSGQRPTDGSRRVMGAYTPFAMEKSDIGFVYLHPSSFVAGLSPHYVVYNDLLFTNKPYMRHVCTVEYEWLQEMLPLLQQADVKRLTGRSQSELDGAPSEDKHDDTPDDKDGDKGKRKRGVQFKLPNVKKELKVSSAKERYLQRKRSRSKKHSS